MSERSKLRGKVRKDRLFELMTPIEGEQRTVYECCDCGQYFGRRTIPFGLGHGLHVGECMCQLTAHRPKKVVETRIP